MLFIFRTKLGKNLVYVRSLRRLSPFPSLKWIEQRDVRTFVPVRDTSFSTENIPTLEIVYRWWERMRMQDSTTELGRSMDRCRYGNVGNGVGQCGDRNVGRGPSLKFQHQLKWLYLAFMGVTIRKCTDSHEFWVIDSI